MFFNLCLSHRARNGKYFCRACLEPFVGFWSVYVACASHGQSVPRTKRGSVERYPWRALTLYWKPPSNAAVVNRVQKALCAPVPKVRSVDPFHSIGFRIQFHRLPFQRIFALEVLAMLGYSYVALPCQESFASPPCAARPRTSSQEVLGIPAQSKALAKRGWTG